MAHASLDATVADVDRLCREFRWNKREQQDAESPGGRIDSGRTAEDIAADRPTSTQRRADALLLMAERSLSAAGTSVSRADR